MPPLARLPSASFAIDGFSAAARDAVKKEALRKAGIGYHEIVAGHTTPSELRALVEKLVPAK